MITKNTLKSENKSVRYNQGFSYDKMEAGP